MKKKSIFVSLVGTALVTTALVGCSGGNSKTTAKPAEGQKTENKDSKSQKKLEIKLAHVGSTTHQNQIAAELFKKAVEEKSKGTIEIKIYPDAKLGSEKDEIEGIKNGTIDMTTVAADSSLANVVPEMNLFGIPFLFKDREHVYKVLDGDIGKSLLKKVDEKGMKGLGYWEVGFRQMTTKNKPITKPEDMSGLKMRVQPAPVWQEFMKTLGANPTAINFNELYSALEQGVVDGQENPIATIMSMKFYEVQKQVSLTNHSYTAGPVLMSKKMYDSLSDEQKKWIEDSVHEAAVAQRKELTDRENKSIEELKAKGVTITTPDREAFAEKTKDVAKVFADKVPQDLIDKIKAAAK